MAGQGIENRKKLQYDGVLGKMFKFLKGMPFSFILLGIIILACIFGSIIPQGQTVNYYMEAYGASKGGLIIGLGMDHVFTAGWFLAIAGLLCLNLILCSVSRIGSILKAWEKNKSIGIWGSWITHLGILLLIITFIAGQMTASEEVVYGIAGSSQPLGNTGLTIDIDSFKVNLREDFTVEQYIAGLTITNEKGEKESGTASVNHPFKAFGYSFYQDSMGWANYVDIYKNGEYVKTDLICTGEYTFPDDMPSLVLFLQAFYPDFEDTAEGFRTKTPLLNNPRSLYGIYYSGQLVNIDLAVMDEPIIVHDYSFVLYDPTEYTLIVAKKDPMAPFVGISALVVVAGLFLSLYVKPWEQKRRKENEES